MEDMQVDLHKIKDFPALQHNMCVDADTNSRVQCQICIWQKYQKVENEEKRNFVINHLELVRY